MLVLSHLDTSGVGIAVERLRSSLEAARFSFAPFLSVTASFGVAGLNGGKTTELKELLSHADVALYRAKQQGRNRIEFVEALTCAK